MFLLNVGEILIDKKYIPVVQSTTWSLAGTMRYVYGSGGKYAGQYLHKIIAGLAGLDVSDQIDHKDGNIYNNLISNLRPATNSQNSMNRKSNNTSGYKGVSWCKVQQKWKAQIQVNKKRINLGYFDDIEEAYAAYCEATRKYFGEFARTEETHEN